MAKPVITVFYYAINEKIKKYVKNYVIIEVPHNC